MATTYPFLDHPLPLPFSHGGGAKEHLDNSWPGFESTVALGYRYLETDTVATKDGVLLTFHDANLDRLTDGKGVIAEMTYDEVKDAKVDGKEAIPRLDEVLRRWPDLRVNIEPKTDEAVDPLVQLIGDTGSIDRVCIGSFKEPRIKRMRKALGPRLCTSIGVGPTVALRISSWGIPFLSGFVQRTGAACAQEPLTEYHLPVADARFVRRAHALGLQVHVWTIDEPAQIERLLDLGVDGIMSDKPTVLKDVLVRRGQWTGSS